MIYKSANVKGVPVIDIIGEVERSWDFRVLFEKVQKMLEARNLLVVIDLTQTTYVSASVCGFLISLYKRAKLFHSKLVVILPLNHSLQKILQCNMIDRMIDIFPHQDLLWRAMEDLQIEKLQNPIAAPALAAASIA